jgi:hypothetical protein
LTILEQRDLPHRVRYFPCHTHKDVARAIRDMSIRGAPAIGCAAAFGLALAAKERTFRRPEDLTAHLEKAPNVSGGHAADGGQPVLGLGTHGPPIYKNPANAKISPPLSNRKPWGSTRKTSLLATPSATRERACFPKNAVGPHPLQRRGPGHRRIRHRPGRHPVRPRSGQNKRVYVDETRPYLQGARLTAWELAQEGIPYEILTDNMAGHILKTEKLAADHRGRRPHRRQWRHRQQNRHLFVGDPGQIPRRSLLRGRPFFHGGHAKTPTGERASPLKNGRWNEVVNCVASPSRRTAPTPATPPLTSLPPNSSPRSSPTGALSRPGTFTPLTGSALRKGKVLQLTGNPHERVRIR